MFLLVWKGWGIVVIGIALVWLFIGGPAAAVLHVDETATAAVAALFLVPAGAMTWYVGKRLNRNSAYALVDPKTGAPVLIRREHSLFFLAVEGWGPVLAAIGILAFIVELVIPR